LWVTTAIDKRSQYYDVIEDIQKTSLDPYVTFRSGYTQRRANDIKKARIARDAAWAKAKVGQ
jgi:ABC-type transporter lipoprotein component MlaA